MTKFFFHQWFMMYPDDAEIVAAVMEGHRDEILGILEIADLFQVAARTQKERLLRLYPPSLPEKK